MLPRHFLTEAFTSTVSIPEHRERFRAYRDANPNWGHLRAVLHDGNISNEAIIRCKEQALAAGDEEGAILAQLILGVGRQIRSRIPLLINSNKPVHPSTALATRHKTRA